MGLSLHRSNWIINWAEKVIGEKTVETHSFAGGVGRLNFSANAILHLKPWMGPLYAWSSTIQLTGKQVATTPWGIKLILLWVSKQLAKDLRLQITPTLPSNGGPIFKSDAKAEAGRATIGGWFCGNGTKPKDAPWFFVELFEQTSPWVLAKAGDPQRIIATLELLGSLLCLVLFDFKATSTCRVVQTITGSTDNLGNTLALQKYMSTKWPLAPMIMELSEQCPSRNLELHLSWQRRNFNTEADALTNRDFSAFQRQNQVHVDFSEYSLVSVD